MRLPSSERRGFRREPGRFIAGRRRSPSAASRGDSTKLRWLNEPTQKLLESADAAVLATDVTDDSCERICVRAAAGPWGSLSPKFDHQGTPNADMVLVHSGKKR